MSKRTICVLTIVGVLIIFVALVWVEFEDSLWIRRGGIPPELLIANHNGDAAKDYGDLPNCRDKWKHILKNPLTIFRFTCIRRDPGAERIRQDHVELPEVISILATADENTLSLRLSAVRHHLGKSEFSAFITDVWRENTKEYPQLPWRLLKKPSRRIDIAAMMNVVDPAGARTYFDFVAGQIRHGNRAARSDAAAALRFFDSDESVSVLEGAIRRTEYTVAYNAVQAMAALRSPSALATLEQLQNDVSITDQVRALIDIQVREIRERQQSFGCPVTRAGHVSVRLKEGVRSKIIQEKNLHMLFVDKGFYEILQELNGMSFHIYIPYYQSFLKEIWDGDVERYPNFNWACLDHPIVRVILAGLLATVEGDEEKKYLTHLRRAAVAPDNDARLHAIVHLGNVGTQRDVDLLVAAIRNDSLEIAKIAAISLRGLAGGAGVPALKALERDSNLGLERRRIVMEILQSQFPGKP